MIIISKDCVDIISTSADPTRNFFRVRFRNPKLFVGGKYSTPQWGQKAAMTIGTKYYGVKGCKITMAQPVGGRWMIQNVLIPKNGGVEMTEELALQIANHIQDRIEREGQWTAVMCRDNETKRYISKINGRHIERDERGRFAPHAAESFEAPRRVNTCTHRYKDTAEFWDYSAWKMMYSDIEVGDGSSGYVETGVRCDICGQERVGSWAIESPKEGFQITKGEEGRMPRMYGFYAAEEFEATAYCKECNKEHYWEMDLNDDVCGLECRDSECDGSYDNPEHEGYHINAKHGASTFPACYFGAKCEKCETNPVAIVAYDDEPYHDEYCSQCWNTNNMVIEGAKQYYQSYNVIPAYAHEIKYMNRIAKKVLNAESWGVESFGAENESYVCLENGKTYRLKKRMASHRPMGWMNESPPLSAGKGCFNCGSKKCIGLEELPYRTFFWPKTKHTGLYGAEEFRNEITYSGLVVNKEQFVKYLNYEIEYYRLKLRELQYENESENEPVVGMNNHEIISDRSIEPFDERRVNRMLEFYDKEYLMQHLIMQHIRDLRAYKNWVEEFYETKSAEEFEADEFEAEREDKLSLLRFNTYFEEEVYRLSPDIYAEVFDKIDYNYKQLKEAYTNPSYYFSMNGYQDRMKQFQNKVRRMDENIYQRAMETAQMRIAKEEEEFGAESHTDRIERLRREMEQAQEELEKIEYCNHQEWNSINGWVDENPFSLTIECPQCGSHGVAEWDEPTAISWDRTHLSEEFEADEFEADTRKYLGVWVQKQGDKHYYLDLDDIFGELRYEPNWKAHGWEHPYWDLEIKGGRARFVKSFNEGVKAFRDEALNMKQTEEFEAEQTQYDVKKGKNGIDYESANYISLHDTFAEAEAVAKRERKNLNDDEVIFIVEESFDDETFALDTNLLLSMGKSQTKETSSDSSFDAEEFEAQQFYNSCSTNQFEIFGRNLFYKCSNLGSVRSQKLTSFSDGGLGSYQGGDYALRLAGGLKKYDVMNTLAEVSQDMQPNSMDDWKEVVSATNQIISATKAQRRMKS